jgi:hypothetical protein
MPSIIINYNITYPYRETPQAFKDKSQNHLQLIQLLQATAATSATVVGGSKGDPLYADSELEHKKGKQSIITPPDMTGVQYIEIKTDQASDEACMSYKMDMCMI